MMDIKLQDLYDLVNYFSKNTYKACNADTTSQRIMQQCILLADLDYTHSVINNNAGELSGHYPSHLIIFESEKSRNPNTCDTPPPPTRATETIYESLCDSNKLKDLMRSARYARCRSRFPLPVILYKGKHVCRSSTLSSGPEIYGRSGLDYLFAGSDTAPAEEEVDEARGGESVGSDWQLFDKVRSQDIKLLKTLNVGTIIDFMVENKKVKFGLNVTSSEKVDKEKRYSEFNIVSLPYPGCEFFKKFRENNYVGEDLLFNWSQPYVDAEIGIPEDSISAQLHIRWRDYRTWDLHTLTANYLRLILKYLTDGSTGLLVHCISGWDRTPLFVSLLRMSMWADGAIHTSLNAYQMLYFTLAYDWMLFGHNLEDRLNKGEEILFFCFDFLKFIEDDEFCVQKHPRPRNNVRNDSESHLDNVLLDGEVSSLSSNLSYSSSTSQENPPTVFHCASAEGHDDSHSSGGSLGPHTLHPSPNKEGTSQGSRSPLLHNRTSPVAVPVPSRLRQRNESTSSGGSWQMISGTGSLRGSTTANAPVHDGLTSSGLCKQNCETCTAPTSQESSSTVVEDEPSTSSSTGGSRKDRLNCLRLMFFNVYSRTVGFRMDNDPEAGGIGQLLGNIAERVGIISNQRPNL